MATEMHSDDQLWEFTKAALQGLLANQAYNSPNVAKYMEAKGLTVEKLAVVSAVECLKELQFYFAACDKERDAKVDTPPSSP